MAERRLRLRHLQRLGPLLKPHAQLHGDRTASLGRRQRLPERRRNRKRSPRSLSTTPPTAQYASGAPSAFASFPSVARRTTAPPGGEMPTAQALSRLGASITCALPCLQDLCKDRCPLCEDLTASSNLVALCFCRPRNELLYPSL